MITEAKRAELRANRPLRKLGAKKKRLKRQGKAGARANPKPNVRTRGGCGWNAKVPGAERQAGFLPRGTANPARAPELSPYQKALEKGTERAGEWKPAGVNFGPVECNECIGDRLEWQPRKVEQRAQKMAWNVMVQHGIVRED